MTNLPQPLASEIETIASDQLRAGVPVVDILRAETAGNGLLSLEHARDLFDSHQDEAAVQVRKARRQALTILRGFDASGISD
jgi:hypothetical protein